MWYSQDRDVPYRWRDRTGDRDLAVSLAHARDHGTVGPTWLCTVSRSARRRRPGAGAVHACRAPLSSRHRWHSAGDQRGAVRSTEHRRKRHATAGHQQQAGCGVYRHWGVNLRLRPNSSRSEHRSHLCATPNDLAALDLIFDGHRQQVAYMSLDHPARRETVARRQSAHRPLRSAGLAGA